jgi:hypothetical protein
MLKNLVLLFTLALCLGLATNVWSGAPENRLFQKLTDAGVQLTEEVVVPLPVPSLADGVDADLQRETVTRIAGRYGWKAFVRPSSVAPFMLKQAYLKDAQGQRVGHAIDLWFIAYTDLSVFQDKQLADDFFARQRSSDQAEDGTVRELSDAELSTLQLTSVNDDRERYVLAEFPLMNRVYVQGIGHAEQQRTDESILLAWELAPGLPQTDALANRWWPIETTRLGERKRGRSQPYQGYGGYLKITTLQEPAGALFCEAHVVFHEPQDWFSGSNFLRSKTPLIVRENVDKLRRELTRIERAKE